MNILKGMNASLSKLWRWIRETAWVQPLLIVGAIFAVIFSIPKATSWVQSFGVGTSTAYFMAQKKSLEGEVKDIDNFDSKADKLTYALMSWSNFAEFNYKNNKQEYGKDEYAKWRADFEASAEKSIIDAAGGDKFYLLYVAKDNDSCDGVQEGLEALEDNWGIRYTADDHGRFAFSTIYTDEDSTNDEDEPLEKDKSAFYRYLCKFDDLGFWGDAGERFDACPYKKNASLTSSENYNNFTNAADKLDASSFVKPTVILVDFSKEAFELGRVGVSEILFGVSGDKSYDKATLLIDMWNHTTKTDANNKFSEAYRG